MFQPSVPDLVELLQATLKDLEQSQNLSPDDPVLMELKHSIVRILAELKLTKLGKSEAA